MTIQKKDLMEHLKGYRWKKEGHNTMKRDGYLLEVVGSLATLLIMGNPVGTIQESAQLSEILDEPEGLWLGRTNLRSARLNQIDPSALAVKRIRWKLPDRVVASKAARSAEGRAKAEREILAEESRAEREAEEKRLEIERNQALARKAIQVMTALMNAGWTSAVLETGHRYTRPDKSQETWYVDVLRTRVNFRKKVIGTSQEILQATAHLDEVTLADGFLLLGEVKVALYPDTNQDLG